MRDLGRIWRRIRSAWRGQASTAGSKSSARRRRPGLDALEERVTASVDLAIMKTEPQILYPITNQVVPVKVEGFVVGTRPNDPPATRFRVIDEYRRFEPSGPITLTHVQGNVYSYSFTVGLLASKGKNDGVGRQYNVLVLASDSDNAVGRYTGVIVPGQPVVKAQFQIPPTRPARARR